MKQHAYFDKYARHNKMRPTGTAHGKHCRILLADSGEPIVEGRRVFYRTGFCLDREGKGLDLASYGEYEIGEAGGSQQEQKFRLADATMSARKLMADLHASGYFDDDRKGDFSTRPGN
jgi:hypothetical protein